ncbi:MAG: thioesterase [Acidobacteria bacterium]|nr:thioesterase [Acidobacteriota bacterium]
MNRVTLNVGESAVVTWTVSKADLASALSPDPQDQFPDVFATSRMIALMELAAAQVMRSLLAEGELSVGVTVDVTHLAPTACGENIRATARYVGQEGKLYLFEVRAEDGGGEVGRGTHRRAIISTSRLLEGANRRRAIKTT